MVGVVVDGGVGSIDMDVGRRPQAAQELLRGLAEQADEHEGEEDDQGEVTGEVTGFGVAAMAVHIGSE